MNPDIKKLTTVFLVLVALISSSALIFSNLGTTAESPQPVVTSDSQDQALPIGQNAFVEEPPYTSFFGSQTSAQTQPTPPTNPPLLDPSNLTDMFVSNLAQVVVQTNPNGPQTVDGQQTLSLPDNETLGQLINQNLGSFQVDNLETVVPEHDLNILARYTSEDVTQYFHSFNQILDQTVNSAEFKNLTQEPPSLEVVGAATLLLDQASKEMKRIPTPSPLAKLHQSFLSYLQSEKNLFLVVNNYESDPLKAIVVAQNETIIRNRIDQHLQDFQNEFKNLNFTKLLSRARERNGFVVALHTLFLVQKAEAVGIFVPTGDILNAPAHTTTASQTTGNLVHRILEFVKKLATEIIKNQIIHRLVQQVISWVQGGGKPQFITNWKQFVDEAVNNAAGAAISQIAPGLCRSFGPLIQLQLKNVYLAPAPPPRCTLDRIVSNIQDFYNNFQNGGWIAYGATMLPSGSFYGSLFEGSQLVGQKTQEAFKEKVAEGQSAGGYLSPKICVDTFEPAFPDDPGGWGAYGEYIGSKGYTVEKPPDCASGTCTGHLCKPGAKQITTPGGLIGHTVGEAVGASPIHEIVNAQDMIALVSALVDSALNHLIKLGVKGLTSVFQGSDTVPNDTTGGGGGTALTATCSMYPSGSPQYAQCIANNGSITSTASSSAESGVKKDTLDLANTLLKDKQDTLTSVTNALQLASTTIALLNTAVATCAPGSASSSLASSQRATLTDTYQTLSDQSDTLNSQIPNLQDAITTIQDHDASDINWFQQQYSALQSTYGTTLDSAQAKTDAQTQVSNLTQAQANAQALLASCSGSQPSPPH